MIQNLNLSPSTSASRADTFAALNVLFRSGTLPAEPLDGRYRGGLAAIDLVPGATQLVQAILSRWLPWQGKRFDAACECGDNIFTRDLYPLARVIWPLYRAYTDDSAATYRAFTFKTSTGPGLFDPDRQVFKLDYDLPGNPPGNVKRVLDELVELPDGTFLGKAHLKLYWSAWKTVAYFTLAQDKSHAR
ncbi:MAG: hypothetical protein KatS3mg053_2917 [Candidatus Roseilinea sp.]|nr:MAG: hypothetical protein KatS3mg053_2917 [Candidatus Roseilinea sp.]